MIILYDSLDSSLYIRVFIILVCNLSYVFHKTDPKSISKYHLIFHSTLFTLLLVEENSEIRVRQL